MTQYFQQLPATSYTVVQEKQLNLPAIEVCLPSRFDITKLEKIGLANQGHVVEVMHLAFATTLLKGYNIQSYRRFFQGMVPSFGRLLGTTQKITDFLQQNNMTYLELLNAVAFNCSDVVQDCYQGEILSHDACSCTTVVSPMGHCLYFPTHTQLQAGPGQGLFIEMRLPKQRFAQGLRRAVDGVAVNAVPDNDERGASPVYAAINGRTGIRVSLTKGVYLPTLKNPCKKRKPGEDPQVLCMAKCMVDELFDSCGLSACRPYEFVETDKPVCLPTEMLLCAHREGQIEKELNDHRLGNCTERCRYFCDVREYNLISDFVPFDADALTAESQPSMQADEIIIDFHYNSLRHVEIRQFYSMSPDQLAGNIGGLVGLWIGGPVLAAAHAIFFWFTSKKKADKG